MKITQDVLDDDALLHLENGGLYLSESDEWELTHKNDLLAAMLFNVVNNSDGAWMEIIRTTLYKFRTGFHYGLKTLRASSDLWYGQHKGRFSVPTLLFTRWGHRWLG